MFKSLSRVIAYSLLLALFINPTTAAFNPASELKITAADGAAGDFFGGSVSIDGTRMAVGAAVADVSGNDEQGAVYIYDFDGSNWIQTAKLVASDGVADDWFGSSVSLSGDRLAVGAAVADVSGNSDQGAAYVFDLSGGSWSETTKLTAADGAANDYFGNSVSLSGDRLAVGADSDDIGANSHQGAAYVFDLSGGSWSQTQKLTAADGAAVDWFGFSVSLSGERLAVGAAGADISGNYNQGAAYVFDLSGGSWSETTKLTAADGAAVDNFGNSVSLSGDRLAVGAFVADVSGNSDQGAAYVFDLSGGSWSQTTKLTAADGAANDHFGNSVSLSGDRLAVGAVVADVSGNSGQGAAYVFDLSGGSWSQTTKLTAADGAAGDLFGYSVSLSGERLAVGAVRADISGNNNQGAAYVYSDTYTIGGNVSGLSGSVTLQNNGGDDLTVNANGTFTFATSVASGGAYSVSVATQPTGQTCTVSNGSGTATANVTNVQVTCTTNTYTIGGNVSGLSGSVTLQNNGGDDLTVSTNGVFTFNTAIAHGSAYAVTVATQPTGQTCTVSNGSGTVNGANVTNVQVTCTTNSYTIGGNVSGLNGTVVLQNNGGDNLTVSTNGVFTFSTAIAHGGNYAVTIATQPTGQTCTVSNGNGTVNAANVTNVQVTCATNTYTIGGSVSGLNGTVVLQNNGGDNLTVSTNGVFTFNTAIIHGGNYAVTIATQPTGQTCTVSNGSGTATANVTNVQVTCTTNSYTIGGNVSGLSGSITLQNNGGDDITMTADGTFTFATAIASGSAYAVTVAAQPTGQTCTVSNGSGTATANVTNVQVTCTAIPSYTVGGTISGLSGTIVLQNNGGDDLTLSTDGPFTFLTALLDGTAYNITILTPPAGQSCTISNGSGTVSGGNIGNIQISCRATTVASVPTINAYGILLMLLAMLGVAWFGVRRS